MRKIRTQLKLFKSVAIYTGLTDVVFPKDYVRAATDFAVGGAEVAEYVHVRRLGHVGGSAPPPQAAPRLAHCIPPATDLPRAPPSAPLTPAQVSPQGEATTHEQLSPSVSLWGHS